MDTTVKGYFISVMLVLLMINGQAWGSEPCNKNHSAICRGIPSHVQIAKIEGINGTTGKIDPWFASMFEPEGYPSYLNNWDNSNVNDWVDIAVYLDIYFPMQDAEMDIYVAALPKVKSGAYEKMQALYIAKPMQPGSDSLIWETFEYWDNRSEKPWSKEPVLMPWYTQSIDPMITFDAYGSGGYHKTIYTPVYPKLADLQPTIARKVFRKGEGQYMYDSSDKGFLLGNFSIKNECSIEGFYHLTPILNTNPQRYNSFYEKVTEEQYKSATCIKDSANITLGIFFFKPGTFEEVDLYSEVGRWNRTAYPTLPHIITEFGINLTFP